MCGRKNIQLDVYVISYATITFDVKEEIYKCSQTNLYSSILCIVSELGSVAYLLYITAQTQNTFRKFYFVNQNSETVGV